MFVLAHLSDPHLAPLPRPRIAELASKRLTGYVNWLRKRRAIHRSDVLATITGDLARARPDHIAVTGDLVNIALPAEFEHARRWLEALGKPTEVSLVPGNHDAYVAGADGLGARHWAPYMAGDAATMGATDSSNCGRVPRLPGGKRRNLPVPAHPGAGGADRRVDGRADAAIHGDGPSGSPADRAHGGAAGRRRGQFRVVLIHHPPHVVPKARFKQLVDAAAFRDAIAAAGAELVIHGHDHVRSLSWIDGPSGRVPVIGVPSASAAFGTDHDAAGYNLYRIDGRPGAWSCEVSCRSVNAVGAVIECERFVA